MNNKYKKYFGKSPEKLRYKGSMSAFLMLDTDELAVSGFSLDISEEEMAEVLTLFENLEGRNEKDN